MTEERERERKVRMTSDVRQPPLRAVGRRVCGGRKRGRVEVGGRDFHFIACTWSDARGEPLEREGCAFERAFSSRVRRSCDSARARSSCYIALVTTTIVPAGEWRGGGHE